MKASKKQVVEIKPKRLIKEESKQSLRQSILKFEAAAPIIASKRNLISKEVKNLKKEVLPQIDLKKRVSSTSSKKSDKKGKAKEPALSSVKKGQRGKKFCP